MNEFDHEIQTSTTMISSNVYTGTYETYLGELLGCVNRNNRAKCEDDVAEIYLYILANELPSGSEVFYNGMYHPRYYNFETDAINFTLKYSDGFKNCLAKYAEDNKHMFDKYLHDNFTTRAEFISFTPNNYDEWLDGFNYDDARCVSVIIGYYLNNESDVDNNRYWFDEKVTKHITEIYIPWDYAVKYHNGYVGYCVENYDEDEDCSRFDAYLFDADGNIVNATHLHDPYWEYRGSAYMAWEEMELDITDGYNHVGYDCEEMDMAEFHQTFDGKF